MCLCLCVCVLKYYVYTVGAETRNWSQTRPSPENPLWASSAVSRWWPAEAERTFGSEEHTNTHTYRLVLKLFREVVLMPVHKKVCVFFSQVPMTTCTGWEPWMLSETLVNFLNASFGLPQQTVLSQCHYYFPTIRLTLLLSQQIYLSKNWVGRPLLWRVKDFGPGFCSYEIPTAWSETAKAPLLRQCWRGTIKHVMGQRSVSLCVLVCQMFHPIINSMIISCYTVQCLNYGKNRKINFKKMGKSHIIWKCQFFL